MVEKKKWYVVTESTRCPFLSMGKCGHPGHPSYATAKHPRCDHDNCPSKIDLPENDPAIAEKD